MLCPNCNEVVDGDPSFQITGIGMCPSCGEIIDIQQIGTDPPIFDVEEEGGDEYS
jgi:uncharacterized Zn finger protein (UPF0148 family)